MKFRPQFDSLIFDLDGTLWDASEPLAEAWNRVLQKSQVHLQITAQDIRSVSGLPFNQCVELLLSSVPERKRPSKEDFDQAEKETLLQIPLVQNQCRQLLTGVAVGFKKLQHEYPLFLVSNCQDWYLDFFLSLPEIRGLFRESRCFGSAQKSKTQNLLELRKKQALQKPVYIGDTQWDQDASFSAGMPFLFIESGFGKVNLKRTPSVRNFTELTKLFLLPANQFPKIELKVLDQSEFQMAKDFYKQVGYAQTLAPDHFYMTARCEKELVGIVRIVQEEGTWVLRGMQIRPDYQFYGVGTKLLSALEKHLSDKECYGIPYAWLEKFYNKIGFEKVDPAQGAPSFLVRRLQEGLASKNKLILMKRTQNR